MEGDKGTKGGKEKKKQKEEKEEEKEEKEEETERNPICVAWLHDWLDRTDKTLSGIKVQSTTVHIVCSSCTVHFYTVQTG